MKSLFYGIVVLILVLGYSGCGGGEAAHRESSEVLEPLLVDTLHPGESVKPVRLPGTVTAREATLLSPRVSGVILELKDEVGASFEQGELLAVLEAEELASRVTLMEAQLKEAEIEYERARVLVEKNAISDAEWTSAQSRLETSRARLDEAETQLSYLKIYAPYDGRIREVLSSRGDLATPGKPLFSIYSKAPQEFSVALPESLQPEISKFNEFTVRLETVDRPLQGTLVEISEHANPATRSYLIKLGLPTEKEIRPGTFGYLEISAGRPVVTLPEEAILRRGQLEYVYEYVDGTAVLRVIRTGATSERGIEVSAGLSSEAVLIQPVDGLRDGHPVKIR